jgi:hypothetical protein
MGIRDFLSDLNEDRKKAQRKLKDEFLGFTSSASRKLIPRELRPALPFLSAAVPFIVPGSGIFSGPLGRALLSSGTNLLAQGLADPEAEDLNLLSAGLAGLTGALSSPELSDSMRAGIDTGTTAREAGIMSQAGRTAVEPSIGFMQGAENIGREGIASMSDFVTGTGETFKKFGRDPGALFDAGVKGARFPGLKELGTAITIPAAQATGDLAYTEAQKALRAFNDFEAEEMARAGADMEAIASARRSAIREAMEVSGFEEDEIMETLGELGLKQGGIVSLAEGGMLDFGGKEMDLRKGGFVPIGKKEKADDVPARLSKNEFVMTADAVRAAGGGSVNKGAQRMYDLMNNLEARA